MSSTFVTLAEVLEARGGPLLEEEIWSLLLGAAEALVDVSYKGKDFQIFLLALTCIMHQCFDQIIIFSYCNPDCVT